MAARTLFVLNYLTSFQVLLISISSLYIVLHILFGLPLYILLFGFQPNISFVSLI